MFIFSAQYISTQCMQHHGMVLERDSVTFILPLLLIHSSLLLYKNLLEKTFTISVCV